LIQTTSATAASSEINWSAGTEADAKEGGEAAGEPERVAVVSTGAEAETVVILEKRKS